MNIFRRLFRIGKAEANSAVDKLEDPIKMTEQGIRDLKEDLDKALQALAEVKALAIRSRNDVDSYAEKAKDYENKAMMLLQQAQKGELDATEADRLATNALVKKEESIAQVARAKQDQEKFENHASTMDSNIKRLKSQISHYENELKTLRARVKVSSATKSINKQMADIDSSSTVSMLERMKEKVAQEEALAESYGELANEARTIDDEIDKALEGASEAQASEALDELKKKMGLLGDGSESSGES